MDFSIIRNSKFSVRFFGPHLRIINEWFDLFHVIFFLPCRATTNKKMRETVALELSFVNSNLQLLKEQLAELNSSVEVYQNGTG